MAIGLQKNTTVIGVMSEVTEGVYLAPASANDYVQPTEDFSVSPAKEVKERPILTSGLAKARSRVGTRSVSASVNLEQRASGVEGAQSDAHKLLKSTLGGNRELAARVTTKTGNSATVLQIQDADIGSFLVGDMIVVLESGAHHISAIIAVDPTGGAANITLLTAAAGAFSDNVEIAKFQTYFPSNNIADYPTLSLSYYHGNEILEKAIGCRSASMGLSSFTTGEIATWDFAMEGIDFDEVDGAAPHTPTFDDATPALILGACVYIDGVQTKLNDFSFSIENSLGFITSTCSESGRIGSRFSDQRSVSGSINPYKDDTSVDFMNKFKANTSFSLFAFSANPSSTAGEYDLGSIVAYYMPNCIITSKTVADLDGVLIDTLEYEADGGVAGSEKEIFIGLV